MFTNTGAGPNGSGGDRDQTAFCSSESETLLHAFSLWLFCELISEALGAAD